MFQERKAVVTLYKGGEIAGRIEFIQGQVDGPVKVNGSVKGLHSQAKHGFHVHERGDVGGSCDGVGAHFNPENVSNL
jgi:Cu-Zn family superoxide dismutase